MRYETRRLHDTGFTQQCDRFTHRVGRPAVVEEEVGVVADLPQLHEHVAQTLARSPTTTLYTRVTIGINCVRVNTAKPGTNQYHRREGIYYA